MLFGLTAEAQGVDDVDDVAQDVATLDFIAQLAEDFADFVFDGIGVVGGVLEFGEVREKVLVYEVAEIVAVARSVVVELAVGSFWRRPGGPAIDWVEHVIESYSGKLGFNLAVFLEVVEVLEEEDPRSLLDVIELVTHARVFPEGVVDVFEGLFKIGGFGGCI